MQVFLATVSYRNEADVSFSETVGVFSSEDNAEEAIENFLEGTLYMQYPDCKNVSSQIDVVQVDESRF